MYPRPTQKSKMFVPSVSAMAIASENSCLQIKFNNLTIAISQRGGNLRHLETLRDLVGVGAQAGHGAAVDARQRGLQVSIAVQVGHVARGQCGGGEVAVVGRDLPFALPLRHTRIRDRLNRWGKTAMRNLSS